MALGTGSRAVYSPLNGRMKIRRIIILMAFAAVLSLRSKCFADVYYRMLFERVVFAMESRADPLGVLAAFQEIAKRHPYDRHYAARAQLYAGICYKRMGSNQAIQAFEKVITNFSDQADIVKIAEAELASLTKHVLPTPKKRREIQPFKVWEGESVYGTAALSGDGRFLCFVDQERGDLILCETTSRKTHRLVSRGSNDSFDGYVENAKFSPDAKQIAYSRQNRRGECELCIIGTDGSGQRIVWRDENAIYIHLAGWTADGGQILAVLARADLTNKIVLVSVSAGSVQLVREMASQWPDHTRISPDGRFLAYSLLQDRNSPERDIFLYDIETDKVIPLVVQPGDDLLLDWTPDSQNILYISSQKGLTGAWILSFREREPRSSARRIKSSIDQGSPIGLTRKGRFYYEVETGRSAGQGPGHNSIEFWAVDNFLPEEKHILTVPDDYPTIQEAIDNANPGATISVRKGEYPENIIVSKSLTLEGEDRETTIIRRDGSGTVVKIMASQVIMSGFTVRNGDCGVEIGPGDSVSHVTLSDMIVTFNKTYGIQSARTGGDHIIENCIISYNAGPYGMYVHQFSRSIIRNCEVFGNDQGLLVGWGWYALVEGNKIYHNRRVGLDVDSCYYTTVTRNLINANELQGMTLPYISRRNTINENIVLGNRIGLAFASVSNWASVGENRLYHNDLIDNQKQVIGQVNEQIWDNGYPSGGNYWSDYEGQDQNDDGIGDAPHELAGEAKDNFPLVKPWNRMQADLDIAPDSLASEDKEGWVTVHIALPAGIPGDEIDPATVLLNNSLSPEKGGFSVSDYNDDGIPDMTVRFNKQKVSRILNPGENIELTISGRLKNGLPFEGAHLLKAH
jgi:nitrous oxidase accessory protein NosD